MEFLDLDIKTILILLTIGNLSAGLALVAYGRRPIVASSMVRYMVGAFLQAAAWLLLAFRGRIPDFWSIHVGNSLLLASFNLECLALAVAGESARRLDALFGAFALGAMLLFYLGPQEPNLRIVTASIGTMLPFGTLALIMFGRRRSRSFLTSLIGASALIYCVIIVFRIWTALRSGPGFSLMTPALAQTLAFVPLYVFTMVGGIGFILLLNEKADRLLHESEEKYRTLVERASEAIVIAQDGKFAFANARMAGLVGADPARIEGSPFSDFVWPEDLGMVSERHFGRLRGEEEPDHYDFRLKGGDGRPIWVSLSTAPISWKGRPATLTLLTEIDTRKRDEERITRLLSEKEILLREVHHRIKNNLTVAMGLLSLQADSASGGGSGVPARDASAVLLDARNRLQVLTGLYDLLHRSASFTEMPVRDFLDPLLEGILAVFPSGASTGLELETGDFSLDVARLTLLGIIVNEIVTNAMKHAFEGGEGVPKSLDPKISVTAFRESGRIRVTCADNGRGLPEGLEPSRSTGLGLQLIEMLSRQLGASCSVEVSGGTRYVLDFPA